MHLYHVCVYVQVYVCASAGVCVCMCVADKVHDNSVVSRVVFGPEKMIVVPPRHYCVVENPVIKDADGDVVMDSAGQIKLQHADQEIRLAQDPFPLYPGEVLKQV